MTQKQPSQVSYAKHKTFLGLYGSYRDTHPFVEEGNKAISFRFTCGHVFDHPTVPVDTNPVCDIVKSDFKVAGLHEPTEMTHLRYLSKGAKSCFDVICGDFRT